MPTEHELVEQYINSGGAITQCAAQAAHGTPEGAAAAVAAKKAPKARAKANTLVPIKGAKGAKGTKLSAGKAICAAYLAGKTIEECVAAAHAAVPASRADRTHVFWYYNKMRKAGTPGLPPWPTVAPKVKAAPAKKAAKTKKA